MTQAFIECGCPGGHVDLLGAHHGTCSLADPDSAVSCIPGSGCCTEDHDHAAAANACPGGHESAACPEEPGRCRVWRGATADASHPLFAGGHPLFDGTEAPPCPGGHCHPDVPGCTVCRPLIITMLPGTQVTLSGQAG